VPDDSRTRAVREAIGPRTRARQKLVIRNAPARLRSVLVVATLSATAVAAVYCGAAAAALLARNQGRVLCGARYTIPRSPARGFVFRDPGSKGVRALTFCWNSSFLAVADGNGLSYIWSMATHRVVAELRDPGSRGVNAIAYRPRSRILATADANGEVFLWPPGTARPRSLKDPRSKGIRALTFSPNGKLLATADGNGHSYLWSMVTDKIVATLYDQDSRGVNSVTFTANGKNVATGDANGQAYIWSVYGQLKGRLHDPGSKGVRAVAFRPRSSLIATADGNGRTYLWRPGKATPSAVADPKPKGADAEAFTRTGRFLVTADADGHLYFWLLSSDNLVEFLPDRDSQGISSLALSPDGRRVAAGDRNGTIYISDCSHIGISAVIKTS
jgi:WD40 repeat protein